jgi:hypothetical protein
MPHLSLSLCVLILGSDRSTASTQKSRQTLNFLLANAALSASGLSEQVWGFARPLRPFMLLVYSKGLRRAAITCLRVASFAPRVLSPLAVGGLLAACLFVAADKAASSPNESAYLSDGTASTTSLIHHPLCKMLSRLSPSHASQTTSYTTHLSCLTRATRLNSQGF